MGKISIPKPSKQSKIPLLDAGIYIARCFKMIHIGTNVEEIMGEKKELNKVRLYFELPEELMVFKEENGEQPRVMSEEFTLSLHEKANLRKFLENWRGKSFSEKDLEDFDLSKLIGAPCMLTVMHKENKKGDVFANISGVSKLMKNTKCQKQINESFCFDYEPFDASKMDKLPDWVAEKIKTSREYLEATGGKTIEQRIPVEDIDAVDEDIVEDDLPF